MIGRRRLNAVPYRRREQVQDVKRMKRLRPLALVALVAIAIGSMAVAGCGSSDSSDGGDGGTTTATAASTGRAVSGKPIKVMTVATVLNTGGNQLSPFENQWEAARVFGEWVNHNGGVGPERQPLDVILCDDKGTPDGAKKCADKAVEGGVTAVLGSYSSNDTTEIETLARGDVAYFGTCCGQSSTGFTSRNSFPFGSQWALSLGMGTAAASQCEAVGIVNFQAPGFTEFTDNLYKTAFRAWGKTIKTEAYVPLDATDLSPQASQVTKDTDCVVFGVGEPQAIQLIQAMKQAGVQGGVRIFGQQGNLTEKACSSGPELCENAVLAGIYPDMSAPALADYRSALEQYRAKEGLDYNSLGGIGTWAAYVAFTNLARTMRGPIDAAAFLKAANATSALDTDGLTPVLNFTQEYSDPQLARMFNRSVTYAGVSGGRFEQLTDDFVDLTPVSRGERIDTGL
jgi:ABC-type branched-subunit amino acid transport system substrate-binding protein